MTPESLTTHLVALGFVHKDESHRTGVDLTATSGATGVSRDTIRSYLAGKYPVPLVFRLALAALMAHLKPLE